MPIALLPSGVEIAYELHGAPENTPVLLIHGHGSRGSTFNDFIPFIETDFYLLTLDLRGHGASGKPLGNSYKDTLSLYSTDQFAEDLFEFVRETLFPTPFLLVGHSMGGMIAQVFALHHPELVSHLVLCGTAATWYSDGRASILTHLKDGTFLLNAEFFQASIPAGMTRAYRKAHPEVIASSVQSRLLVPPDVYIASFEQVLYSFDTREQLPYLSIPTLILVGDRDAMVEPARSYELKALLPNAQMVVVDGQNHGLFHEVPERVATEMKSFLRSNAV